MSSPVPAVIDASAHLGFQLAAMCAGGRGCDAGPVSLRCLIVDDSDHFLEAARRLLEGEGIAVVGMASTAAEALTRFDECRPDVTLVDIELGTENGFDLARRLAGTGAARPPDVILISTYAEGDFGEVIAESPAIAFLAKSELSAGAIRGLLRDQGGREGRGGRGAERVRGDDHPQ
jgi:CheY-like chemotaxis protein